MLTWDVCLTAAVGHVKVRLSTVSCLWPLLGSKSQGGAWGRLSLSLWSGRDLSDQNHTHRLTNHRWQRKPQRLGVPDGSQSNSVRKQMKWAMTKCIDLTIKWPIIPSKSNKGSRSLAAEVLHLWATTQRVQWIRFSAFFYLYVQQIRSWLPKLFDLIYF